MSAIYFSRVRVFRLRGTARCQPTSVNPRHFGLGEHETCNLAIDDTMGVVPADVTQSDGRFAGLEVVFENRLLPVLSQNTNEVICK